MTAKLTPVFAGTCATRELPPLTAAEVGEARITSDGVASISLSPDERWLAVAPRGDAAVCLYTVHSLVASGAAAQPVATWQLPPGDAAVQVSPPSDYGS